MTEQPKPVDPVPPHHLPTTVFQDLEKRDENQILAEMRGELVEELVYSIDIHGRQVTNLSYGGVKEATRRRGGVEILEIRTEETDRDFRVLVKVRDHLNRIDVLGVSTAEKNQPFAYVLAHNKAERNAFAKLIPARWFAELIHEYLERRKVRTPAEDAKPIAQVPAGPRICPTCHCNYSELSEDGYQNHLAYCRNPGWET